MPEDRVCTVEFKANSDDGCMVYVNGRYAGWSCDLVGTIFSAQRKGKKFIACLVFKEIDGVRRLGVSLNGREPRGDDWLVAREGLHFKSTKKGIVFTQTEDDGSRTPIMIFPWE